jgi:hypothetical protein
VLGGALLFEPFGQALQGFLLLDISVGATLSQEEILLAFELLCVPTSTYVGSSPGCALVASNSPALPGLLAASAYTRSLNFVVLFLYSMFFTPRRISSA